MMMDKNTGTFHEILNNGQNLELEMIRIELKHGYKSPAYRRFEKFKQRYYDIFEEILISHGYKLYDVPDIFYSYFWPWYKINTKKYGNPRRVKVIYKFLKQYEK